MKTSVSLIALGLVLASPAMAESPYERADDTWISIDGTVHSVRDDSFILDYGRGHVVVEMDDGDRDAGAYEFSMGDKVNVSGTIDDDFFDTTSIKASSVYVEDVGTYFFASSMDDEALYDRFVTVRNPIVVSETVMQGTVTGVGNNQFTVNTDLRKIIVETGDMPYDPLDTEGYQRIEVGDVVSVGGRLHDDFFEGRVFDADVVTIIHSS